MRCFIKKDVWVAAVLLLLFFCLTGPAVASELHEAAKEGNLEEVRQLATEENIDRQDEGGITALRYACAYGRKKVVEFLISAGAKVNLADKDGWAPLHCAAADGHNKICNMLLSGGAHIEAKAGPYQWTPLCLALFKRHSEVAKLLVEKGADVNYKAAFGRVPETPLAIAAWRGLDEIVKILLEEGAKDPWLSKVPGFDPYNFHAVQAYIGEEEGRPEYVFVGGEGGIKMQKGGASPLVAQYTAKRPWEEYEGQALTPGEFNFFCWRSPQEGKRKLAVIEIEDGQGDKTLLFVAAPAFVNKKGIVYRPGTYATLEEGPFANLTVDCDEGSINRVEIVRDDGSVKTLDKNQKGDFTAILEKVAFYEPVTVKVYNEQGRLQASVDFDCVLGGATRGSVFYRIQNKSSSGSN